MKLRAAVLVVLAFVGGLALACAKRPTPTDAALKAAPNSEAGAASSRGAASPSKSEMLPPSVISKAETAVSLAITLSQEESGEEPYPVTLSFVRRGEADAAPDEEELRSTRSRMPLGTSHQAVVPIDAPARVEVAAFLNDIRGPLLARAVVSVRGERSELSLRLPKLEPNRFTIVRVYDAQGVLLGKKAGSRAPVEVNDDVFGMEALGRADGSYWIPKRMASPVASVLRLTTPTTSKLRVLTLDGVLKTVPYSPAALTPIEVRL